MVKEYPCATGPGHAERELTALMSRTIQSVQTRALQIFVEGANGCLSNDVTRRRYRECGNRHAARACLEQHEPERIGAAWEHEHIGGCVDFGQGFTLLRANEYGIRKFPRQAAPCRAFADDQLCPGQVELQKSVKVF